jgi:hypothetical protein
MIYPALTYLEEIGHATVEAEGTRKRYHITDGGRDYLEQHRAITETMLQQLSRIGQRMDGVRRAFAGEDSRHSHADHHAGHHAGHARHDPSAAAELRSALRAVRLALHRRHHGAAEELRRIAEILRRAAADIAGR